MKHLLFAIYKMCLILHPIMLSFYCFSCKYETNFITLDLVDKVKPDLR